MIDKSWKPRVFDVAWTKNHIDRLSHDAFWGIPMNRSIWRVDKVNRVLRCVYGKQDDLYHRITVCSSLIGYTTEYALEIVPQHVIDSHLMGSGKTQERTASLANG